MEKAILWGGLEALINACDGVSAPYSPIFGMRINGHGRSNVVLIASELKCEARAFIPIVTMEGSNMPNRLLFLIKSHAQAMSMSILYRSK